MGDGACFEVSASISASLSESSSLDEDSAGLVLAATAFFAPASSLSESLESSLESSSESLSALALVVAAEGLAFVSSSLEDSSESSSLDEEGGFAWALALALAGAAVFFEDLALTSSSEESLESESESSLDAGLGAFTGFDALEAFAPLVAFAGAALAGFTDLVSLPFAFADLEPILVGEARRIWEVQGKGVRRKMENRIRPNFRRDTATPVLGPAHVQERLDRWGRKDRQPWLKQTTSTSSSAALVLQSVSPQRESYCAPDLLTAISYSS